MTSLTKDILIDAKGVSKKFSKSLHTSLFYGVWDLFFKSNRSGLRRSEFWSLRNISFQVRRGECLGLIGHNGAGKSTLLKILSGLLSPDEGEVKVIGKVGALIELGAGFSPILSGRENIYNNGAILGLEKKEIDENIDAIIEFSGLGEFIDTPLQSYSSGMKVRLGFAVATQFQPDILLVDEVLAVGDLGFTLKCFSRIDQLLPNTAVIFVSHSMPQIFKICTKVMLLDGGKNIFLGEVSEGINNYYDLFPSQGASFNSKDNITVKSISGYSTSYPALQTSTVKSHHLDTITIFLEIEFDTNFASPEFVFIIYDKEQRAVGMSKSTIQSQDLEEHKIRVDFPGINLSQGIYSAAIAINKEKNGELLLRAENLICIQIIDINTVWTPIMFDTKWSLA